MADKTRELKLVISAYDKGLKTGLQQARKELSGYRQETVKAGKGTTLLANATSGLAGKVTALISAYVGFRTITGIFKTVINGAKEAETAQYNMAASIHAASREFDNTGSVDHWQQAVKRLSDEMVVYSETSIKNAVSRTIDMTKRLGLSVEQMEVLIARTADLSAGKTDLEGGIERVTAALRGEAESAEYLGLTLGENYVKKWYEANTAHEKAWKDLTDLEKAQIRYQVVLEQTASVQGRAAGSANTFNGAMEMIKATIADAIANNEDLTTALEGVAVVLSENADEIGAYAGKLVEGVAKVIEFTVQHKEMITTIAGLAGSAVILLGLANAVNILAAAGQTLTAINFATAIGGWITSLQGMVAGLTATQGLVVALGAAVAVLATQQIAKAVSAIYQWIQAENKLNQVTGELTTAQQNLIGKTREFADVRIPPGMLAMPTQELKTLENQLLHTATYWKTELSQLKQKAQETNWFGQATEEAKKAQAAMDGVKTRWQQAEDELSRVQTELKTRTDEVATAQRDEAAALDDTAAAADRLAAATKGLDIVDAEYALQLKELELALAQEIITEEEYRQKRLAAEKAHWQQMIEIRKTALEAMAAAGKKGSKEYVEGLKAMRQAELNLIKTDKQIQGSMKKVGDSMKETGAKGKDAAQTAEAAWQKLADMVGTTVEELKAGIAGITSEVENATARVRSSFMGTFDEEGNRVSRTNSHTFGEMTYDQLQMQYDTLMRKLSFGWGFADDYDYLRIIAEKMATLEGLTEEQTSELQKQTEMDAHRNTRLQEDPHRNWMYGYASGGSIPGVGDRDSVPAMLTPGEYVIRKSIVSRLGRGFFDALNSGVRRLPTIRPPQMPVQKFAAGGPVTASETITVDLKIGGRSHPGAYAPDVAGSLIRALRSARLTTAAG